MRAGLFRLSVSLHALAYLDVKDQCQLRAASADCLDIVERSSGMRELRRLFASLRGSARCTEPLYPLPPPLRAPVWRRILTSEVLSDTLTTLQNIVRLKAVQSAVWSKRHLTKGIAERVHGLPESVASCLQYEFARERADDNFVLVPSASSGTVFVGILVGLADTPYAGGVFHFTLNISPLYPFEPPTIRFVTPILHPCMHANHEPCLSVLKHEWSPAFRLRSVVLSLSSELFSPLHGKYSALSPLDSSGCSKESIGLLCQSSTSFESQAARCTRTFSSDVDRIMSDATTPAAIKSALHLNSDANDASGASDAANQNTYVV